MKFSPAIAVCMFLTCSSGFAQVQVDGYYNKNGTYVAPHYRSSPDSSRLNNYSTQGNVNPYTGQAGTVNPYATPSPSAAPNPYGQNPYGQNPYAVPNQNPYRR
jgi:hypothetical protein